MKLGDIYDFFIQEGIKKDLRTRSQVHKKLAESRKEYRQLKKSHSKFFDKERLTNPYADTRILHGSRHKEVKRILVGIDIEIGELLLADHLSRSGAPIDLVLAHHPEGLALAGLDDVMDLQTECLSNLGIQNEVARDLMGNRIKEVSRRLHSANHTRSVDAAQLLDIPFMCCHTPADNHVATYLQKKMDQHKPKTLQHIVELLLKEPEYQDAMRNRAGPRILIGGPKDKAGRIIVDMTGGTEGSKEIFARISQIGITTQLSMHLSEEHFRKIKTEHIQVVVAGHMASDNLGMNLLLDKLERKGPLEILACSGFRRFNRHGAHSR